jgi:hypothetical protein
MTKNKSKNFKKAGMKIKKTGLKNETSLVSLEQVNSRSCLSLFSFTCSKHTT